VGSAFQFLENANPHAQQTSRGEYAQQRIAGDHVEHVANKGRNRARSANDSGQTGSTLLKPFLLS